MKPARILYFIDGNAPTPEDYETASELKANVVFRNARAVPSEAHSLEICDGVAGKVPKIYADAYPNAEAAIETKAAELKALSSKVGDAPAPKHKTNQNNKQTPTVPQGATGQAPAWNPNPAQ